MRVCNENCKNFSYNPRNRGEKLKLVLLIIIILIARNKFKIIQNLVYIK